MKLSLRGKLLGSALLLIALCAVGSLIAISRLGSVRSSGLDLHDRAYTPTTAALEVSALGKDLTLQNVRYQLLVAQVGVEAASKSPQLKAILAQSTKDQRALAKAMPDLRAAPAAQQDEVRGITSGIKDYNSTLAAALKVKDPRQGAALAARLPKLSAQIEDDALAFAAESDDYAKAAQQHIDRSYTSGRNAVIAALLVAVLVGLAGALRITAVVRDGTRRILTGLRSLRDNDTAALRQGLQAIAEGDLTRTAAAVTEPIAVRSSDEIGAIAKMVEEIRLDTVTSIEAYNTSLDGLGSMIGRVSASASTLSQASEQMASTSREAGRAVTEIASAVEDVATGAERQVQAVDGARRLTSDMVEAARASAHTAGETAKSAEAAREVAVEGAAAVAQATDAMAAVREASTHATEAIRDLGAKSEQIGGIVDAITGIAEQTNLLALNAAIEAARAGEQGRGFAVVAEEVRKLAEESQQAAASIAALIGEIQHETKRAVEVVELGGSRTDQGTETVEHAREAFERINGQVQEMGARVGEIAAAVENLAQTSSRMDAEIADVASVSEQTSAATEQVSASTQETSAATQQIASSAGTLAQTAGELTRLVAEFKLPA